jgi:hypothetical protein
VHFDPVGNPSAGVGDVEVGGFVQVRIDSAAPHHLRGTLVAVEEAVSRPRAKVPIRIPVHAG